jgi:hypothetical protein
MLLGALLALPSIALAQFPLGPGGQGPRLVVDPAINDYITRAVAEHAVGAPCVGRDGGYTVELVSARRQGDLVFVFSRVRWSRSTLLSRGREHVVEVQYSMVQRPNTRRVFELWCRETRPRVYDHYDLGRIRTRINEELHRFDEIDGDRAYPGPYARGPSTVVPTLAPVSAVKVVEGSVENAGPRSEGTSNAGVPASSTTNAPVPPSIPIPIAPKGAPTRKADPLPPAANDPPKPIPVSPPPKH